MDSDTIVIGSDHAGWELKEAIKEQLEGKGFKVDDVSEPAYNAEDDLPLRWAAWQNATTTPMYLCSAAGSPSRPKHS
jgi:ribose 5-phosphate isomerase RpiB